MTDASNASHAAKKESLMSATRCIWILIACLAIDAFGMDASTFDSGGVPIHYIERGEGDPIVLIHGFTRSAELTWDQPGFIDLLAAENRVIALDCRGHGKSGKPHQAEVYGIEMVRDVVRLLDHLSIESAHLVGYSMGGRIALKFAARYPDRVRSAVLIAAGGARKDDSHALWHDGADSLERGDGIMPLLQYLWPRDDDSTDEQLKAVNVLTLRANSSASLAAVARQYEAFAVSDEDILAIRAPIHVIIGSDDPFLADAKRLENALPMTELTVIEGADHLNVLSHQRTRAVLDGRFLSRSLNDADGGQQGIP
jgi:pimeloyl-ACP methyl ester carboxylesterase